MNKIKLFATLLCGMLLTACGESLEDTYSEYTNGGEIRYLGKCVNVDATPGWKRIILKWENNVDPLIKHTKIVWKNEGYVDSVIVDRGVDEYNINTLNGGELMDGSYEISLTALGDNGYTSIPQTTYCRPYTETHEEVIGFTKLISRIYVIKHNLVLSMTGWTDEIKNAQLNYTKRDGTATTLELTPEIANQYYYLVGEIDESKPVTLNRKGELPGCGDIIDFDPTELSTERIYDASFRQEMVNRGISDLSDSWANSVETLSFDYDLVSLLDILNLPNLKKIELGKHRYQLSSGINDTTYGQSAITELEGTNFAIALMGKLCGTKVEVYNKHYQGITGSNVTRNLTPVEPTKKFIDLSNAKVTNSQEHELFSSYTERLTDGDKSTYWYPMPSDTYLTYDLVIDLKNKKNVNGIRIIQRDFSNNIEELSIAPAIVKLYVSNDQVNWNQATYSEENTIGKSNGETSYVDFKPEVAKEQYRYVKLTINAGCYRNSYYSQLAELSLY